MSGMRFRNALLASMDRKDLAWLAPHLSPCDLPTGMTAELAGSGIEAIYFPEAGIVSVSVAIAPRREAEVGLIGRDGMTGVDALFGATTATSTSRVCLPGEALSIAPAVLLDALAQSARLRGLLSAYARKLLLQARVAAVANARCRLEHRLARWLLMCSNRSDSDDFEITHDTLAGILGARRPAVTLGVQVLEGKGCIRANRGAITIRDRDKLADIVAEALPACGRETLSASEPELVCVE